MGSSVVPYRFDRTSGQRFLASNPLNLIFGLLADVRVRVLERTCEVLRGHVTANIAIDARAVNVESAGDVFFYAVVGIRHCSRRALNADKMSALPAYGCVISSGLTNSSTFSPVNNPSSIADSRRLIFFLCAFLAIFAELS